MGQGQSAQPTLTKEQLSDQLALRFLRHSFTDIEVYSFKDNFVSLAQSVTHHAPSPPGSSSGAADPSSTTSSGTTSGEQHHQLLYWTEDTLTRFLALPDALVPIGPILYHSATHLGAFPFEDSLAPVVLTFEALVKVVVLMTGRHTKVLKRTRADRGRIDWVKVLWRSFAVWERELGHDGDVEGGAEEKAVPELQEEEPKAQPLPEDALFSIGGSDDEDMDDESLTLAALDALDAITAFELPEPSSAKEKEKPATTKKARILSAHIPLDNLRKIIMLLLLTAPLEPTQPIAVFVNRFTGEGLVGLQAAAENVLRTFTTAELEAKEDRNGSGMATGNGRGKKGIGWREFKAVMRSLTERYIQPNLFDGFAPLFEHLLFSKNVDMSSASKSPSILSPPTPTLIAPDGSVPSPPTLLDLTQPLLPTPGRILTVDTLSQLSLFIKGPTLWRRLRPLYAGSSAGFSMGSFETRVLKWQAPTILLVSGTRITSPPSSARERAFWDSLPQKRYPTSALSGDESGAGEPERLVFGVYLNVPWKLSHKSTFGDFETLLFQLEPVHEVFLPSKTATSYVYFNKTDGIAFGNALQEQGVAGKYKVPHHDDAGQHRHHRRASTGLNVDGLGGHGLMLGPVSLTFDENLEFGVFNHTDDGGAFHRSESRRVVVPEGVGMGVDDRCWQDRFEIDEVEVWGLGGDKEAEEQRKSWAWEEREALARRGINIGKDVEADRALLEMAGLIGGNRSGGVWVR
ncbi:TLD-domain-containing protein [Kalaharituber pfeilii]|nr:TLD-domain-containing protein [Kalaharituber pfeilii]